MTYIQLRQTFHMPLTEKKGSFWQRLRDALKDRGQPVTQKQVARRFGVRQPTISGTWAKPGKGPEIALGTRIAAEYHLNIHYLYTGEGAAEVPPPDPLTQDLLRAWMRIRATHHAGTLKAYADTLLKQIASEGSGDTPIEDPFLRRDTERSSVSKPA